MKLGDFIESDKLLPQQIGEARESKLTAILKVHSLAAEVSFKAVHQFVFDPNRLSMMPGRVFWFLSRMKHGI
jgi:hypothetical protein